LPSEHCVKAVPWFDQIQKVFVLGLAKHNGQSLKSLSVSCFEICKPFLQKVLTRKSCFVDGGPVELTPGPYGIVIRSGSEVLKAGDVVISERRLTTLELPAIDSMGRHLKYPRLPK